MAFYERFAPGTYQNYEDFYQNYKVNVPENFNYGFDVVDQIAAEDPGRIAMVWCNELGEEHTFTFQDISEQSAKVANYMKSLGIKKGDRVMLLLKRHYEFWFTVIACHKLGAVMIPASNLLKAKDVRYRVEAANIRAIFCTGDGTVAAEVDAGLADVSFPVERIMAHGTREGWRRFEEAYECSAVFPRPQGEEATKNEDVMLLFFTSGTTGMPKMVEHDYTYPLGHIVTAAFWQGVKPGGLHLTVSDTGWGKALWGKLYGQWMADCAVFTYDYDKFVPTDLLQKIQDYRITSFCAPPTIYRFFVQEDLTKYDFSALEQTATAGEALNPEVLHKFEKATGLRIQEAFGQTETTVVLGTFLFMDQVPGSMGKPCPPYDVIIADENGEPVHLGSTGEISIRIHGKKPTGLFCGYFNDPERTRAALSTGLYRTGDMAWQDENGYFWYIGRADDVIKSSGYRIGPFEVESALMEHPAVLETAITAVPHPIRGQVVKATIVLAAGYTPSEELKKELQDHVKRVTAPYKYPRIVEFVDELPKTISGKIRRVEIRARDAEK